MHLKKNSNQSSKNETVRGLTRQSEYLSLEELTETVAKRSSFFCDQS